MLWLFLFGVYLFRSFGDNSKETIDKIEEAQLAQFNNKFQKFYGERTNEEGKKEAIKCTIHDIASLANLAQRNNIDYNLEKEKGYSKGSYYIQIDVNNERNIEKYTNNELVKLIKTNDLKVSENEIKYYKCITCNIDSITKKVNYMKFVEI